MRLVESIFKNINEDYVVGGEKNKQRLTQGISDLYKRLNELGNKTFTKEFGEKLCKAYKINPEDKVVLLFVNAFDMGPIDLDIFNVGDNTYYLYPTISLDTYHDTLEVDYADTEPGTYMSVNEPADARVSKDGAFVLYPDAFAGFNGAFTPKEVEVCTDMLKYKGVILGEVEKCYNGIKEHIYDICNKQSENRKNTIANAQRDFAKVTKEYK